MPDRKPPSPGLPRPPPLRAQGHSPSPRQPPPLPAQSPFIARTAPLGVSQAGFSPHEPQQPGRRSVGRLLTWIVVVLLLVTGGAISAAALLSPLDLVRDEVIARVKQRTGRTITIGQASLSSVLPRVGVTLENVVVPALPGFGPEPTAKIAAVDLQISPWSLLVRKVRLSRVTLRDPIFDLTISEDGRRGWDLANPADAATADAPRPRARAERAAPTEVAPGTSGSRLMPPFSRSSAPLMGEAARNRLLARLEGLAINDVRINGATVVFRDLGQGREHQLTGVDVKLKMKSLDQPLQIDGAGIWRNEPVNIGIRLASLPAFLTEQPTEAVVKLSAVPATFAYDGRLTVTNHVGLDGRLTLEAKQLDRLAAWLSNRDLAGLATGGASFAATVRVSDRQFAVSEMEVSIAGARTTGAFSIEESDELSTIRAALVADTFDFGRLGELVGAVQLLRQGGSEAKSAPLATDPKRPLTVASERLSRIDGDLQLTATAAVWRGVKLGPSKTRFTLKNGRAEVDLLDAQIYAGRASGKIAFELGSPAKASADIALDNVAVGDLLQDAIGTPWVAGHTKGRLAVTGVGDDADALLASLSGRASIAVTSGSIGGFNLAEFIKGALARGDKAGRRPTDRTEFSELSGTFAIQAGVAETRDMVLNAPQFKLGGAGNLSLHARTLDVTVRPSAVTIPGLGTSIDLQRFNLPITIRGPWSKPAVSLDNQRLQGMIRSPERAGEIAKELGKGLAGTKLGKRINELMASEEVGPDGTPRKLKPREVLERLLKRQPKAEPAPPVAQPQAPAAKE